MERVHVLVEMHGLNVQDVKVFVGPNATKHAESEFFEHTGISYASYQKRRAAGEDNNQILGEDEEGTEIYVVNPIVCE